MGSLRSNLTLALVCLLIHVLAASALKGVPKKSDKCPEQFPNEAICLGPESDSASGCFAELAVSCCGCMASTCYGCPNSATCATELGETCKKGIWSPRALIATIVISVLVVGLVIFLVLFAKGYRCQWMNEKDDLDELTPEEKHEKRQKLEKANADFWTYFFTSSASRTSTTSSTALDTSSSSV